MGCCSKLKQVIANWAKIKVDGYKKKQKAKKEELFCFDQKLYEEIKKNWLKK